MTKKELEEVANKVVTAINYAFSDLIAYCALANFLVLVSAFLFFTFNSLVYRSIILIVCVLLIIMIVLLLKDILRSDFDIAKKAIVNAIEPLLNDV